MAEDFKLVGALVVELETLYSELTGKLKTAIFCCNKHGAWQLLPCWQSNGHNRHRSRQEVVSGYCGVMIMGNDGVFRLSFWHGVKFPWCRLAVRLLPFRTCRVDSRWSFHFPNRCLVNTCYTCFEL